MALTPEDVVNKRFQPTKFREGYDQDEVDDFLDEVVVELRRLNQENEELRQRLIAGESRINELQRSAQAPQQSVDAATPTAAPAYAAPVPVPAPYPMAADPSAVDPSNTNNLLQLARKLHEEHVREGIEKRDALIAEGHATAARVVSEAEAQQRQQIGQLDQERTALERRIEGLRTFEREYRQKLKSYIEGQLEELDSVNSVAQGGQPQGGQPQGGQPQDAQPQVAAAPGQQAYPQQPLSQSQPQPALYGGNGGQQPPASFQGFGGN